MNSFYENSFFRKKKILVIVPHMDDEINVAGSMIHNLAGMKCDIAVLYTTDGNDLGRGAERREEARRALRVLTGSETAVGVLPFKSQARVGKEHYLFSRREEAVERLFCFIKKYYPEIIFCCDMDEHPDHLCTSLFFEEALGKVLKEEKEYSPFVYKGFAYETAYFATNDFFSRMGGHVLQTKKRRCPHGSAGNTGNPAYLWEERIRFPVKEECIAAGEAIQKNVIRNALSMHRTQNAIKHAGRIINSDEVFFERRTDSLSYQAVIRVSSGEKGYLNDFMVLNVKDVLKKKLVYTDYLWIPDRRDKQKCIDMNFEVPVLCNKVVCYQNIEKSHRIKRAQLSFDNGYSAEWDMEKGSSVCMVKCFPDMWVEKIQFKILEVSGENAGVSELEVYYDRREPVYDFIKIIHKENFVYGQNYVKRPDYQVYGYCRRLGSRLLGKEDIIETIYTDRAGQEILRAGLKGHQDKVYDEILLHKVSKKQMYQDFISLGEELFLAWLRNRWDSICTLWSKCRMFWRLMRERSRECFTKHMNRKC